MTLTWPEVFLTVMSSLIGMELFAWWAHKYIMHGWGWGWHRDHHEPHDNMFERNDLFAVVFGTINAGMYIYGSLYWDALWWAAVGVPLYGLISFSCLENSSKTLASAIQRRKEEVVVWNIRNGRKELYKEI